jgi:hypothetical protein
VGFPDHRHALLGLHPGQHRLRNFHQDLRAVINEMARCDAEDLIEARLLRGGEGVLDAVALRLKPGGADWLRLHGIH